MNICFILIVLGFYTFPFSVGDIRITVYLGLNLFKTYYSIAHRFAPKSEMDANEKGKKGENTRMSV